MNKKQIIIITIVIALAIGVWAIKNMQKTSEENSLQKAEENINEDFKLKASGNLNLNKLKEYNLPIMIDFGADYCMPCRQMAPYLREMNEEMQGKAIIKYVDTVRYPQIAEKYPVELIPTQILFTNEGKPLVIENPEAKGLEYIKNENGEHELTIHIGMLTKEQMRELLKEMGLN